VKEVDKIFKNLLFKLINEHNVKQTEIAGNLGVTPLKLSNIKRGTSSGDQHMLDKLYTSYPFLIDKQEEKQDGRYLQALQEVVSLQKENARLRSQRTIERAELEKIIDQKIAKELQKFKT
jgi:transcriptional regulator with XRE-family HTH domain